MLCCVCCISYSNIWHVVPIKGPVPSVSWSHSADLVSPLTNAAFYGLGTLGETRGEMWVFGGCTSNTYSNELAILKLGVNIVADNCTISGDGSIAVTAGELSSFVISVREKEYD